MPTTDELNIVISAETGNAAQNIQSTSKALDDLGAHADRADDDVGKLVEAMTAAATNMTSISESISQSASSLTSFQGGIDSVTAALQEINSAVSQSNAAFTGAAASVTELASASETSASALNGIVSATDGFAGRMSDLENSTDGTTKGLTDLQAELRTTLDSLRGFSGNITSAGNDAQDAAQKIIGLADSMQKLPSGNSVAGLAAGFKTLKSVIATLGVAKFVKDSNDAYIVQMENELKLTQHMKRRMSATNEEIQAVKDLASAQQRLGVIGDEIQLAGAQQLTTYARESSTLKTLLPVMNDLIAQNSGFEASVGDATSAADMLGRALNGQYTSLKRYGVAFTEAQENVLKYGTESEKAAVLAEALNEKVGGLNALLAQTPTGKYKQLQNELGDLQEEIGATFQPLISSGVPVIRGTMETLREPIIAVSRGIATIGQAITAIDSPAVRGIALAAGALAVVNKLKFAIGSTSAGLLLLGTIIAGIVGSMQKEQESISDTVANAMSASETATDGATNAMSDYNDEAVKTEKTLNRLAGFDTLTKLSGGSSSGALVDALLGSDGLSEIYAATSAAGDLNDALEGITSPSIKVDTSGALGEIQSFINNAKTVITNLGDDEAVYDPLKSMTESIKNLLNANGLDGTAFVNFWVKVGNNINKNWRHGLEDIDTAFRQTFGTLGETWSNFWQGFGTDISEFTQIIKAVSQGDWGAAEAYLLKMQDSNPFFSKETKDALNRTGDALLRGDAAGANIAADEVLKDLQQGVTDFGAVIDKAREMNPFWNTYDGIDDALNNFGMRFGSSLQEKQTGYLPMATNQIHTIYDDMAEWESEAQQKSETRYTDVPLRATGIPTSALSAMDNANVNIYINGEKFDVDDVKMTGGK